MFKNFLKQIFSYQEQNKYNFTILNDATLSGNNITTNIDEEKNVYPSLDVNLEHIKVKYNFLINSDINIREFTLIAKNTEYKAAMIYIDGLIDSNLVNDFILKPLMSRHFDTLDYRGKNCT